MRTALVISGGGCKGAFAIGAIEWLLNKGEKFDIFVGTSTGSLISTLIAADEFGLAKKIYSTVKTKDLLKKRCCLTLPWRDAIYNDSGLKKVIEENLTEELFKKIQGRDLYICTVSLNSGKVFYWNPLGISIDKFKLALLASCNQPGFMPPVQVFKNGDYHLDGGVREIVPISKAISLGADRVIVIKLSPANVKFSEKKYNRIASILVRSLDLMTAEIKAGDISNFIDNPNVTIIEPEKELTGNSLKFIPEEMKKMMETGYNRAKEILP